MTNITVDRMHYHQMMESFKSMLKPGSLVYDVGKSHIHCYKESFKDFRLKTLDRDPRKNPDFLVDLEDMTGLMDLLEEWPMAGLAPADAVLFNGVVEQADNPFRLIQNLSLIVKPGGLVLFGMISIGRPLFDYDRIRFTPQGAERLVRINGYEILRQEAVGSAESPSYVFMIARKK